MLIIFYNISVVLCFDQANCEHKILLSITLLTPNSVCVFVCILYNIYIYILYIYIYILRDTNDSNLCVEQQIENKCDFSDLKCLKLLKQMLEKRH